MAGSGQFLVPLGIEGPIPAGDVLGLTFTGLPSRCARCSPFLEDLDAEVERRPPHSARTAGRRFAASFFPSWSAAPTGFTLALARALGEYGSVISWPATCVPYGNRFRPDRRPPGRIRTTARRRPFASCCSAFSFVLLAVINVLQRWSKSHGS